MELLSCTLAIVCMISTFVQESGSWPEGTYGLPMSDMGCPLSYEFVWEEGSRTQKTEPGSHAMEGNHLAGIDATKEDPTDKLTSSFCIKTSHSQDGESEWQAGRYCIYKKDRCPKDFLEGWIYWDDSVPYVGSMQGQDYSGTVPDGEYDRNTLIEFCCRKDGYAHHTISLPTESPFYLLRYGDACQKVEDMTVKEEWVYWAGTDNINWDGHDGVYPYAERARFPTVYTRLFYCYYEPKPDRDLYGLVNVIGMFTGGIIGASFMTFILVSICVRILIWIGKEIRKSVLETLETCREIAQECGQCWRKVCAPCRKVDDDDVEQTSSTTEPNNQNDASQSQQQRNSNENVDNDNETQHQSSSDSNCQDVEASVDCKIASPDQQPSTPYRPPVVRQPRQVRNARLPEVRGKGARQQYTSGRIVVGGQGNIARSQSNSNTQQINANPISRQEVINNSDQGINRNVEVHQENEVDSQEQREDPGQPPQAMEGNETECMPVSPDFTPMSLPPSYEDVMAGRYDVHIDTPL